CMQPMEVGPCKAEIERWYFDIRAQECVRFTYGGCDGNRNNFASKSDCEQAC
ncbi:uncharacterized protein MONBRDRAFT_3838, partial [Monosiga brevicollis MX1]